MPSDSSSNRIRELRLKARLTQGALAELAGTSQQQIARIESGSQTARFDLAVRISTALDKPLEMVFPASASAVRKLRKTSDDERKSDELIGGKLTDAFADGGIDFDPRTWFIKLRLINGVDVVYQVSSSEQRRIRRALGDQSASPLVFDSTDLRVLVNLRHLDCVHFLFEPSSVVSEKSGDDADNVIVYTASTSEPLCFSVETDEPLDPSDDEQLGQFGHLFAMAELSTWDDQQLEFTDGDGEDVVLFAHRVSLLSVPLSIVEPEQSDSTDEAEENETVVP